MKILLINPPWISKGGIWQDISSCMPPFGLAALAAYLEKYNFDVEILDCDALKLDYKKVADLLRQKATPSFIGVTATTATITAALKVAETSKGVFPSARIIMGGIHPSVKTDEVLKYSFVDFVVRGEGEETLKELVCGVEYEKVSGLSYKINEKIIHNLPRNIIPDINTLPLPAYHLLPIKKYFPAMGSYKKLPAIGMITTRGCPGRCTFCMGNYLGQKVRTRSSEKIFEEILLLHEKYGIKEISFYDDVFTTKKENVKDLCKKMIDEKLNISWSCFARVDFIDDDLLKIMKAAGCHQVMYGVESGDEEILKNIHKKVYLEKVEEIIKLTKKHKIDVRAAFMLGNPGETTETMQKTIKYAVKIDPDIVIFNITTPYPGSEMFNWAKEKGILITENWDEYDLSKPIMELPTVKSEEIVNYYRKAYKSFYLRPKYLLKNLLGIRSLLDIKVRFLSLLAIIKR